MWAARCGSVLSDSFLLHFHWLFGLTLFSVCLFQGSQRAPAEVIGNYLSHKFKIFSLLFNLRGLVDDIDFTLFLLVLFRYRKRIPVEVVCKRPRLRWT